MSEHYILDGKKAIPCDLMTWARAFEKQGRHVAFSEKDGVKVSTVFLGLDHRFGDSGPPLIFETMIFGGEHDQYQERYSTWEEAEAGHKVACELAGVPFAAKEQP
jgi:hypothetical protein